MPKNLGTTKPGSAGVLLPGMEGRIVREDEFPKDVDTQAEEFADLVEQFRDNLIIVGLVGLIDPLKPSIPDVVKTCRGAGIRFFVVTGTSNPRILRRS